MEEKQQCESIHEHVHAVWVGREGKAGEGKGRDSNGEIHVEKNRRKAKT